MITGGLWGSYYGMNLLCRGQSMAKRKQKPTEHLDPPPREQQAKAEFIRAGMAYRRVPVIVTLASNGTLNQRQFEALSRYRDTAIASERSPVRSNMDFSPRADGNGRPHFGITTDFELSRMERNLGQLADIARAIAVDDITIPEWVEAKIGTIGMRDNEIARIHRAARKIATVEIKMAGEWLAA